MKTIKEVIEAAHIKRKKVDESNITRAYEFSKKAHEGQKRKSGEPYFIHPTEVAFIIAEMGLDDASSWQVFCMMLSKTPQFQSKKLRWLSAKK